MKYYFFTRLKISIFQKMNKFLAKFENLIVFVPDLQKNYNSFIYQFHGRIQFELRFSDAFIVLIPYFDPTPMQSLYNCAVILIQKWGVLKILMFQKSEKEAVREKKGRLWTEIDVNVSALLLCAAHFITNSLLKVQFWVRIKFLGLNLYWKLMFQKIHFNSWFLQI